MRVRDLMTEEVLTIGPEAPLKDVAAILVYHGISGLPVCDVEGNVLGVTAPAITIAPYRSVPDAARVMCERRVNRLPVVKDERLVGIVTRADLVRAFVRTDEAIEQELREDILERTLWLAPGTVDVEVERGVVELSGRLHKRSDVELLDRLAARIPGVLSVESRVLWEVDDSTRKGRRALEQTRR